MAHSLQALSKQECQNRFAEIISVHPASGNVAVTVRIVGAEADIHGGADESTIGMVLRILKSC